MPEIGEAQLTKELTAGELRGLYVLMGEEKYLLKRAARRVIRKAAGDAFPEFNRSELPAAVSIDALADAAMALPLFAQHKCVAVQDLDVDGLDSGDTKKLLELVGASPETTTLVFWYPTLEFDPKKAKWKNFLSAARERGGVVDFAQRGVSDLARLLMREAEKAGCTLSRRNAEKLMEYAGRDITRLLNELEKLIAYALGRGEEEITGGMIEETAYKSTETTVFLMSGALLGGEYEKAYRLLDALFYQNEEPVAILAALASAYVDMYRVQTALKSGRPGAAAAEYGEYRGREFRLRQAERNLRGLRPGALQESLALLLEADGALKSSRLSGRIVLEELIAKLLLAAKGERAS